LKRILASNTEITDFQYQLFHSHKTSKAFEIFKLIHTEFSLV